MSHIRISSIGRFVLVVVLIFYCLLFNSCDQNEEDSGKLNRPPFVVAIVGDGVDGPTGQINTFKLIGRVPASEATINARQGLAMWQGAEIAYNHSPSLNSARKLFRIKGYDDRGNLEVARKIARALRKDPHVIAVIGHATSGTTREGAWLYSQAGIPLLMPIATSPNAAFPPSSEIVEENRLQNYFRLPPSDDRVQAPAIVFYAMDILKAESCFLLRDISADAAEYSGPLVESLQELIPYCRVEHAPQNINRNEPSIAHVPIAIAAESPDVVIFCGYGTTVHRLIHVLRMHYRDNADLKRPRLILTDGCKTGELDTSGFETYVTFPVPDIGDIQRDTDDFAVLTKHIPIGVEQSYHIYGYDAMLFIGTSIKDIQEEKISRRTILGELRKDSRYFCGVVGEYDFIHGENVRAGYYVYKAISDGTGKSEFVCHDYIDGEKIRQILTRKQ